MRLSATWIDDTSSDEISILACLRVGNVGTSGGLFVAWFEPMSELELPVTSSLHASIVTNPPRILA